MLVLPRDGNLDSTLALLAGGYEFIGERCRRHLPDIFETRLMLRLLTAAMLHDVPLQDLRIDQSRLPAIPRSRFAIANVSPTG